MKRWNWTMTGYCPPEYDFSGYTADELATAMDLHLLDGCPTQSVACPECAAISTAIEHLCASPAIIVERCVCESDACSKCTADPKEGN